MKILFIHTRYFQSRGGEDTVVDAEAKLLTEAGHDVKLLLFENYPGKGLAAKMKIAAKAMYNRSSAKKLKITLNEFRPDIIHLHNFFFEASPAIIIESHRAKIPIAVTIHNYRLICVNALLLRDNRVCELCVQKTFPWPGIYHKCYHGSALESMVVGSMSAIHKINGTWLNKVSQYLAPSEFVKTKLIHSSLKIPGEKIAVKRNFADDPGFSPFEDREDFFLFAGRLSEEKGIITLIRCARDLPQTRFVIAGDGPQRELLVREFGHLPNIRFLGLVDKSEVTRLLKTCTALIFPSVCYEAAPLTIVEAFATGTPIIASRLGAMQELISDTVNGLFFEAGNEQDLEKAVIAMQTAGPAYYEAARQSYLDQFHPDKCYSSVMNIYESIIAKKK